MSIYVEGAYADPVLIHGWMIVNESAPLLKKGQVYKLHPTQIRKKILVKPDEPTQWVEVMYHFYTKDLFNPATLIEVTVL